MHAVQLQCGKGSLTSSGSSEKASLEEMPVELGFEVKGTKWRRNKWTSSEVSRPTAE